MEQLKRCERVIDAATKNSGNPSRARQRANQIEKRLKKYDADPDLVNQYDVTKDPSVDKCIVRFAQACAHNAGVKGKLLDWEFENNTTGLKAPEDSNV